jgi:hypothetical protein
MLAASEWFAGNAGGHFDAIQRSVAMNPDNHIIHWALGYTYALIGRTDDAGEQARWMQAHVPDMSDTAQLVSLVDAMHGRRDAALETVARVDVAPLDAH